MGADSMDLIRLLYRDWARGDFSNSELFDPDVVHIRIGADAPIGEQGEWHGLAEMWSSVAEYLRAWADVHNDPERFIDLGDRVLVLDRHIARGRHSGILVEQEIGNLFTVRDGRIVRWEFYWRRSDAIRAAGLKKLP